MRLRSIASDLQNIHLFFLPRPKKLLFEHIPKCGGSTVQDYLRSQYLRVNTFLIDGGNSEKSISQFLQMPEARRHSFDLVMGHGAHRLRKYAHPEIRKAVIFREPVERIVSHYFYILRTPEHYLHDVVVSNCNSLQDYVSSRFSEEIRNNYVARLLEMTAEDVEAAPARSVDHACSVVTNEYDFYGTLDQLDAVMVTLATTLGLHSPFTSKRINATLGRPAVKNVEPEAISLIETMNALDISFYERISSSTHQ